MSGIKMFSQHDEETTKTFKIDRREREREKQIISFEYTHI